MIKENPIPERSLVFYDPVVTLDSETLIQTKKDVRLIAYTIEGIDYWIATNPFDLEAEQIAEAYRLRW